MKWLHFLLFSISCIQVTTITQFITNYIAFGITGIQFLSKVHIVIEQTTANVFRFGFLLTEQDSLLNLYVNGKRCYPTCSVRVSVGDTVSMAYDPTDINFIVFKQEQKTTDLYFRGCLQDMSHCKMAVLPRSEILACESSLVVGPIQHMADCRTTPSTTASIISTTLLKSTDYSTSTAATVRSSTAIENLPLCEYFYAVWEVQCLNNVYNCKSDNTSSNAPRSTTTFHSSLTTDAEAPVTEAMTTTTQNTGKGSTSADSTPKIPETTTTLPNNQLTTKIALTTPTTVTTTESPTDILRDLSDSGVSLENVTVALTTTQNITDNSNNLDAEQIYYVSNILTDSANLTGLPESDAVLILQNIDNVLSANVQDISESGAQQSFIDVLPLMVSNCNASSVQFLNGDNLGFASTNVGQVSNFNGLLDEGTSFKTLRGDEKQGKRNAISVPVDFSKGTCDGCGGMNKILFTIYRNRKFFSSRNNYRPYESYSKVSRDEEDEYPNPCDRQTQLPDDSPVLTATIVDGGNSAVSRLDSEQVMAYTQFNVTSLLRPLHGQYQVTWWDESAQDWASSDLCKSKLEDGIVYSTCSHLTDFTLIIDSMVNDPNVCDQVLTDVGLVTNTASILSLLFLIIIQSSAYLPFIASTIFCRKILGTSARNPDTIQLFFNIVLFLFYMVFTIFSNQKYSGKACVFMAALAYSLLVCSILLTIFQAQRTVILFFPSLIRKFNEIVLKPISAFSICFLIPFVLSVVLSFFTDFFKRNDGFCWVRPEYVIYATVVPVSILILNAILCTSLVIWRMCQARRKYSKHGRHHDGQLRTKILSILVLQVTMGMPWIVQYFTLYHPETTAWHYVFSIVIGSQGTMFAFVYFYKRRKIYRRDTTEKRRKLGVMDSNGISSDNSRELTVISNT